jgi:ABC-type oligopeptide transport system ATPase subunit
MHEGRIVETAATDDIFENPRAPYTQRLIAALSRSAPPTQAEACATGQA